MKHFRRIMYAVAFALCLVLFGCSKSNPTTTKKTTKTTPTESKTTSKVTKKGNYTISTNNEYMFAGSVDHTINPDGTITIVAKANAPFVFDGWYEGDVKLSGDSSYTVTSSRNYNIDAKWGCTDSTIAYLPSHFTNRTMEKSISGVTISNVTKVFIPKGITNIDYNSFAACATLESVYIPTSVKYFGQNAFDGCNPLKVYYDGSIYDWLKIAFSNGVGNPMSACGSLYFKTYSESGTETSFGWNYNQIKDIYEIPSNVYELNYCGFAGIVELESLVIPTSVTKIGYGFLWNSGVETIYYGGTSEEWDNIQYDSLGKTVDIIPYSETEKSGSWHYFNNVPVMWGDEPTCYTLTTTNSDTSAGTCTIYTNQSFIAGTPVTLTATPNEGYVFDGWYFGENKEYKIEDSDTEEFSLLLVTDLELTAKWNIQSSPTYYTVTTTNDDETGGTCTIYTNKQFAAGDDVYLRATPADGYVFIGWYDGDTKVNESVYYIIYGINKNYNLTAKWALQSTTNYYLLTVTNENRNYGSCAIYTKQQFEAGSLIILNATPEDGYAFDGWYNGETKVSADPNYTFHINSNLTLVGKWIEASVGQYVLTTVNSYATAGSITSYTNQVFEENASVTLTATSVDSYYYVFDGWYNGETLVSSANPYTFNITSNLTLTAKWKLMFDTFVDEYEGRPVGGTYTEYSGALFNPNDEIELTATTDVSLGYTFDGWYAWSHYSTCFGRVSENPNFTYKITESVALEARWVEYTVTTKPCYNSGNDVPDSMDYYYIAGTFRTLTEERFTAGQKVELTAEPKEECVTWVGWYKQTGNHTDGYTYTLLSTSETYDYTMTKETVTIVAKFLLYKVIATDSDNNPTIIEYGYYPQSEVTDETLKTTLASYAGDLPTAEDNKTWTSYGYYDDDVVSNYMWYKDIDINSDGFMDYRGVYLTKYRPTSTSGTAYSTGSGETNSNIYQNGYRKETVYWFKYEPIIWDVVDDAGAGDKRIVSRYVLDGQNWYINSADRPDGLDVIYPSNYEHSTIRSWLNNSFYYNVFDIYRQKNNTPNATDNSITSTGSTNTNNYLCNDTIDKVYLLSRAEHKAYLDGKTYEKGRPTDYAKIQGVNVSNSGTSAGYVSYWLRTPANSATSAFNSSNSGGYSSNPIREVKGIRPAIDMML